MFREFQSRGLVMVGVSLRESPETVRAWGADADVRFPLWLDPGGETPTAFGVRGHPTTVLIDRAGRIVGRVPGERDWASPAARMLIEWLLEQKADQSTR
jgi:peroxiredoxin